MLKIFNDVLKINNIYLNTVHIFLCVISCENLQAEYSDKHLIQHSSR